MRHKKKLRIALIFGGTSQEREISLKSGKNVAENLSKKKYDVTPVEISEKGQWLISSPTIKQIEKLGYTKKISSNREIVPIDKNSQGKIDVAFLALHGPGGEDGTIQGVLQSLGVKYTGSGILASALAMDKAKTKRVVASEGILVAPHVILNSEEYRKNSKKYLNKLHGKLVIKPNRIGSSLGVTIAKSKKEIKAGIRRAFEHDSEILIEEYLSGRELTVPVLGNQKLQALPVIEILPKRGSEFFDFRAKYNPDYSDEIVPAHIPRSLAKNLQERAVLIHKLLGCRGVSRSDFIVKDNGQIYFLEINTIPGMTANSLTPKSAKAAGISYPQFLDKLIGLALDKE
ncbi:MAG: D-alanine--D-alanine ligase [Candidatus Doudnabacteria bacterium]